MSEPTLITALSALERKGAELSHRARIAGVTGQGNEFFLEMVMESARAVSFWSELLEKAMDAERNHGA